MDAVCGVKEKTPGYRFESTEYNQWQVIVPLNGVLGMTVGETDTLLRPGRAVVLPFASAFALWCRGQGYRGVFAILSGPGGPSWTGPALPVGVDRDLAHAADLVERETRCPGHRSEAYLAAAGRLLAEQTLRAVQDAKAGPGVHAPTPEYWVARARPLVERSIYSSASLGRVLGGLGIGYRQITRHFRTVLGTTPKQHQLDCRMSEARRLLRSTDLSVTSIALELGFSDSQHFSTLFAHREGTCPSNWRRESRSPGAR